MKIKSNTQGDELGVLTSTMSPAFIAGLRASRARFADLATAAGKKTFGVKPAIDASGAVSPVRAGSVAGQARPWGEVLRAIGAIKGSKADGQQTPVEQGKALPWSEVMRKIQAEGR